MCMCLQRGMKGRTRCVQRVNAVTLCCRGIRLRGGGGGGDGDGEKGGENPIMGLWNSYLTALETRPFVTRMATGFFIGLIGDIICQVQIRSNSRFPHYSLRPVWS